MAHISNAWAVIVRHLEKLFSSGRWELELPSETHASVEHTSTLIEFPGMDITAVLRLSGTRVTPAGISGICASNSAGYAMSNKAQHEPITLSRACPGSPLYFTEVTRKLATQKHS